MENNLFQPFKNRGKYHFMKYSYDQKPKASGILSVEIDKSYFNEFMS